MFCNQVTNLKFLLRQNLNFQTLKYFKPKYFLPERGVKQKEVLGLLCTYIDIYLGRKKDEVFNDYFLSGKVIIGGGGG